MSNSIVWDKLKLMYPRAKIQHAYNIDKKWTGVAMTIDWLLIVITVNGMVTVELMDKEYPYEADKVQFICIDQAIDFVKEQVSTLLMISHD